jgi:hypothetical protein
MRNHLKIDVFLVWQVHNFQKISFVEMKLIVPLTMTYLKA